MNINEGRKRANALDEADELKDYRDRFHYPHLEGNQKVIYYTGNSLGLQPKTTESYIQKELADWAKYGVEGHTHARKPWLSYHERLTHKMAQMVGAKDAETVIMNSLTVNLHLMMVSFYRPEGKRRKVMLEYSPFPSDIYAVASQIRYHGGNPDTDMIFLEPDEGEIVSDRQIQSTIERHKDELAMIMIGGVNYYTGQYYPLESIVEWGHECGAMVGFDLAHGAGNIQPNLHDIGADFAVWCSYKYLNSGPGSLAGCFVHERYHGKRDIPRYEGWWGQNKVRRFLMEDEFDPIPTVEAWQLSNPPILSMAAIEASLDVFHDADFDRICAKRDQLTQFLYNELMVQNWPFLKILTPKDTRRRGCQLSLVFEGYDKKIHEQLAYKGVIVDWREPNVIRVAPAPLYNQYSEVIDFIQIIKEIVDEQ